MIQEEISLVLISFYCGIVFAVVYDGIRIFRRLFQPGIIQIIIEDLIYWICVAYIFFNMLIMNNYGRLRFYPVIGMLLAMGAYEFFIGRRIVDFVSSIAKKIIKSLLKPLKKIKKQLKLKKEKVGRNIAEHRRKRKAPTKRKKVNPCRREVRKEKGNGKASRRCRKEERVQQHQE